MEEKQNKQTKLCCNWYKPERIPFILEQEERNGGGIGSGLRMSAAHQLLLLLKMVGVLYTWLATWPYKY